jgi:hypothetical protein
MIPIAEVSIRLGRGTGRKKSLVLIGSESSPINRARTHPIAAQRR